MTIEDLKKICSALKSADRNAIDCSKREAKDYLLIVAERHGLNLRQTGAKYINLRSFDGVRIAFFDAMVIALREAVEAGIAAPVKNYANFTAEEIVSPEEAQARKNLAFVESFAEQCNFKSIAAIAGAYREKHNGNVSEFMNAYFLTAEEAEIVLTEAIAQEFSDELDQMVADAKLTADCILTAPSIDVPQEAKQKSDDELCEWFCKACNYPNMQQVWAGYNEDFVSFDGFRNYYHLSRDEARRLLELAKRAHNTEREREEVAANLTACTPRGEQILGSAEWASEPARMLSLCSESSEINRIVEDVKKYAFFDGTLEALFQVYHYGARSLARDIIKELGEERVELLAYAKTKDEFFRAVAEWLEEL